jgi:glycerophosphoryl diester phosphodiesterase
LVIGHRGATGAPENTLEGLAAAVAAGADLVEFDVGPGLVLGHPGKEAPERRPTLEDALGYLAEQEIGIHVDLKLARIEDEVAAAVHRHGVGQRVVVSSTWAAPLRRLARGAPELTRAISYPRDRVGASAIAWPAPVTRWSAAALRSAMPARVPLLLALARADALSLHHALVSRAVVRAAHRRGVAVIAWTVNDPARLERLAALGVDAIVTDDPVRALGVLAQPPGGASPGGHGQEGGRVVA